MVKTILCYGDSNTWGYIPGNGQRYSYEKRWPGILARELGLGYRVIEEGLPGRYTVWSEPYRPGRNGAELLLPLLESHSPIDLLIVMLGTNDVLHFKENTAYDAAQGASILVDIAQKSTAGPGGSAPQVLLVSPPRMATLSPDLRIRCHGDPEKSAEFANYFLTVAKDRDCFLLDAAQLCEPSRVDGVHLDEEGHRNLAKGVWAQVGQILHIQSRHAQSRLYASSH